MSGGQMAVVAAMAVAMAVAGGLVWGQERPDPMLFRHGFEPAKAASEPVYADQLRAKLTPYLPPPGSFNEIPNTAINPVLISCNDITESYGIGCQASRFAVYAWTGMAFDPARYRWYLPAGGGHTDYGGNEIYLFDFLQLRWQRLTEPSPLWGEAQNEDGSCPLPQSGPPATHTYDGVQWVAPWNGFVWFGSYHFCYGPLGPSSTWFFHADEKRWQRREELDFLAEKARTALDQNNNRLYVVNIQAAAAFSLDQPADAFVPSYQRKMERFSDGDGVFVPGLNAIYATARQGLYAMGVSDEGMSNFRKIYDYPGLHGFAVEYHPPTHQLVMWKGGDEVLFWDLDQQQMVARAHPQTGPTPSRYGEQTGVYSKWHYLPEVDAFIGYFNHEEGIWLYRHPRSPAEIAREGGASLNASVANAASALKRLEAAPPVDSAAVKALPGIAEIDRQLAILYRKMAAALERSTPQHTDLRALQARIEALEGERAALAQRR